MRRIATTRALRVLGIHLTKPSNSEANVLFHLLKHTDVDIEVELLVNRRGRNDPASFFRSTLPRVHVRSVEVGLPIDPQVPRSLPRRLASRLHHLFRRNVALRVARGYRPDVVYTSQQKFDCHIGENISRQLGIPQVVHLHYTPGAWLGARALARLKTCERVVAVSRYIGRLAQEAGVDSSRIVILPNTIEVPADLQRGTRSHEIITVGQIGRMAPGKGFEDTVRSFAKLKERVPSSRLVLVGEGSEREHLEGLIGELRLTDSVRITGWQRDPLKWLEEIDVFISPSRHEPFGLTALEASAAGLPVVAYNEGGTAEIIIHGETGLLARPGDVSHLTEELIRLCLDAEMRATMGRAGRERAASKFNPADAGRALSDVLRASVDRRAPVIEQARPTG
jgi:glycosyltransferase involved in cell wall biosynthesis